MNIKNNIRTALLSAVFAFGATSCNDWLNVEMEDAIMENTLFSDDEGYLSALTGCYIRLNENYDNLLTRGGIDVMAQYYHVSPNTDHAMYKYVAFQYDQLESENDALWTKQYSNIANLNVILEHVANDGKLSEKYYNYVKGECLALRAFLHFDLMRIYGPIYGPDTENKITIPYQDTSSKEIQPLLPAKEVMAKIIRDLEEACKLLETDRVREDGPQGQSVSDEKPTLRYRQFRLNYFATKLLLARVYMWIGDKEKAEAVAKEVINENNKNVKDDQGNTTVFSAFPWVKKSDIDEPKDGNPDRLFSSEVMFAVYDSKRSDFYNSRFASTLNMSAALYFSNWTEKEEGYWGNTYEYSKMTYFMDDVNDLRRKCQWESSKINGGKEGEEWNGYYLSKFRSPEVSSTGTSLTDNSKLNLYMIPLIRLSEAYLIVAECEAEKDNLQEAIDAINQLRLHRNTPNLELTAEDNKESVKAYVTKEFMREVVGEGQLFFYYKRNAMAKVLSDAPCTTIGAWSSSTVIDKDMNLGNYTWPMPKCEMDKRVTKQ